MIKKLLLTFSFVVLATFAFSGTMYAAQAGETIVMSEELSNLNKLYIEGFITEEEFSKAKSILLNPDSGTTKKEEKKWWQWPDKEMEEKKKAVILKKQKLTAVERRDLEELKAAKKDEKILGKKKKLTAVERKNLEELEKEEMKAAKKAERERKSEERKRQAEEKELARQTCKDNPEVKCPSTVLRTLKKLNIFKKN